MAKLKDSRVYGNLDIDSVLTVSSDTTINGNLTVTGNTIYSYVDTMKITDPILEMGGAESGALTGDDNKDRGSLLHYYDGAVVDAFMGWDNSASEFALGSNVSVTNEVVTFNTYGNLRVGTIFGNGSGLTNIPGGNVDGTVGYANMSSYAGIVTGATQSNITTVGTLTNVSTSGNITASGNLSVTGGSTLTGDVDMSGNATIDGDLTVGGTIYANISGNLTAPGTDTQVLFNDDGGVNAVAGFTFNKTNQSLTLAGNVSGDTIIGNLFSGNGANLSSITGANVTGYVANATHANIADAANVAYSIAGANVSGEVSVANTVSNATQSNITAVGTLTSLTVSGNISGQANLAITSNATVGGDLSVTGDISGADGTFSGTMQVTGNANVGNLGTSGLITATGNVTGGNLNTTGTANIGNLEISGKTTGNLIPSANVTYDLGNLTHRWNDLYLSGNTIYLGDQTLEANATALFTSADIGAGNMRVTNNTFSGNVYANSGLVKGSTLEGTLTVNSNAQPNITSVGTLVDLDVTGNIAAGGLLTDNLYYANGVAWDLQQAAGDTGQIQFNTGDNFDASTNLTYSTTGDGTLTAAGNISAAKLTSTADTSVGANLTVGTNATVTGDISGAKITVTGDANSGNVYTTNVTATDTVTAVDVVTTTVTATTSDISINAAGTNANVVLAPTGTGTVDVSSKRITSVGSPSADADAATKGYVDSIAQGLSVKTSAHVATTTALPAYTYDNGTDGVGATLTADTNGVLSNIDNHGFSVGDRILVKDEVGANKPYNGVYTVTNLGTVSAPWVLTRAEDVDEVTDFKGAFIFVADGTVNKNTGWAFSIAYESYSTVGTDDAAFTQFSGAGTYSADNGLELTGTVFSAVVDDSTIEVGAGNALRVKDGLTLVTPNIGAATGTSLDLSGDVDVGGNLAVTGNVDANNFNGTFYGSFVGTVDATVGAAGANTEIQFNDAGNIGANSTFTFNKTTSTLSVGNVSATGDVSGSTLTGALTTAAQPNITSVGELTSLTVAGNITTSGTAGNISGANYVIANYFSGNGSTLSSITGSNVVGDVSGANHANVADSANLVLGANVSGDVSGANHANIADVANVAYSVNGANVSGTVATANYVVQSNQSNITQVGTLIDLTVTGNVATGGILTDNYYYANGAAVDFQTAAGNAGEIQFKTASGNDLAASANFKFNSSTNVLTVTGNISGANVVSATTVTATDLTGTLTTAAQPNITSVGEMTGLTVRGISDFGSNANVKITGGTSGQYLQTDGLGALSWSTINTSLLSNGTSNVSVASNGNITLNVAASEIVKISGVGANVTGVLDVSGNVTANNITAANLIVAEGNVDSTSSITGTVKVTGGIGATGNIYTGQSVGFANNNGGTSSAAYIQYNSGANSLDFIFN